jgi:hypothetical protein
VSSTQGSAPCRASAPSGRQALAAKLTLGFATLVGLMLPMVALAFVAGGNATNDINLTEGVGGPASTPIGTEAFAGRYR